MAWFNPRDNQGGRFVLGDLEAGHTWEESAGGEGDTGRKWLERVEFVETSWYK
jgi:hypothetical protein